MSYVNLPLSFLTPSPLLRYEILSARKAPLSPSQSLVTMVRETSLFSPPPPGVALTCRMKRFLKSSTSPPTRMRSSPPAPFPRPSLGFACSSEEASRLHSAASLLAFISALLSMTVSFASSSSFFSF